jgi:hypothetical protein
VPVEGVEVRVLSSALRFFIQYKIQYKIVTK